MHPLNYDDGQGQVILPQPLLFPNKETVARQSVELFIKICSLKIRSIYDLELKLLGQSKKICFEFSWVNSLRLKLTFGGTFFL